MVCGRRSQRGEEDQVNEKSSIRAERKYIFCSAFIFHCDDGGLRQCWNHVQDDNHKDVRSEEWRSERPGKLGSEGFTEVTGWLLCFKIQETNHGLHASIMPRHRAG